MYPSLPWSFLGLDSSETSFEKSKFIIVPVPYDSTASYRSGSRNGPHSIIEASRHLELFDIELKQEPYTKGVFTLDELEPVRGNATETLNRIYSATKDIFRKNKTPILVGGEHTITLGAVKAVPKDCIIVVLDAHADLRNNYQGDALSHACVMRRILEQGKRVVEIGVRSISEEEFQFANKNKIPIFYRETIRKRGIRKFLKDLQEILREQKVYLSIDIDVLDPSEAPAVSTPEPDGLKFEEVQKIVREICYVSDVKGFDLMEVTPIPGNTITEFLSAKLLYKMIGYI